MTVCHEFPQVLRHDSVEIAAKKVKIANTNLKKWCLQKEMLEMTK